MNAKVGGGGVSGRSFSSCCGPSSVVKGAGVDCFVTVAVVVAIVVCGQRVVGNGSTSERVARYDRAVIARDRHTVPPES